MTQKTENYMRVLNSNLKNAFQLLGICNPWRMNEAPLVLVWTMVPLIDVWLALNEVGDALCKGS